MNEVLVAVILFYEYGVRVWVLRLKSRTAGSTAHRPWDRRPTNAPWEQPTTRGHRDVHALVSPMLDCMNIHANKQGI